MLNFINEGHRMPYTNGTSAVIASGDVVVLNSDRCAISLNDIAISGQGVLAMEGVYERPAVNNAAFDVGDKLYWDATAGKLTKTSTDNSYAGICWEAKTTTATTAKFRLGH